jgi:CheY-like chemotaxis protein
MNSPDKSSKSKILIVDDDPELLTILNSECELIGCLPFTATGGQEALDILSLTPIDLVISDVVMPKMSGLELLKIVRTKFGIKPEFALMSGHSGVTLWDAYHFGAEAYLGKPFSIDVLEELIMRVNCFSICLTPNKHLADRNPLVTADFNQCRIGRGGIFVPADNEYLTKNSAVDFSLARTDAKDSFCGTGMIRWVRGHSSPEKLLPGIGIEISSLDSSSLDLFKNKNTAEILIPFIPRE